MKTLITLTIFLAMITLSTAFSQEIKDLNFIKSTCKRTPIYDLCVATIQAAPGSANADMVGLAEIMIRAVEAKSKEALSAVKNLMKKGDPKLADALKRCKHVYTTVIEADVPSALDAVRGVPKFAETAMADASAEAHVCEGQFEGKSPLSAVNKGVDDLGVVARALIRNLL